MSGGGARAAYQVGLLRCISRRIPDLKIPYITGISAGAINAAKLAAATGSFSEAVEELTQAWCSISPDQVFRQERFNLLKNAILWGFRLLAGKQSKRFKVEGLVDSEPLSTYLHKHLQTDADGRLPGIEKNLDEGWLKALAISTTNYMTGQTITWTQGCDLEGWEGINQRSQKTYIGIKHIMASAALPIFFPAVKLNGGWFGDGGIRLYAPLSPAIHLGADKILAISTRYNRSVEEEHRPLVQGYPPPAQIIGVLMNSVFLDLLDQDADRLQRTNEMLKKIPEEKRNGKRIIDLFILRPSQDLGKLAGDYEAKLPAAFRYLMRGQGVHEISSPDWLSMIMFQHEYVSRLIELGEQDAENRLEELKIFFEA
jgi:NTE family protein